MTDADGDTATAALNLGAGVFTIEDDGPNAVVANATAAAIVLDETRPLGTQTDGDSAPAGLASATANFSANFAAADFGTDGAGSASYSLAADRHECGSGLFALDATDTETADSTRSARARRSCSTSRQHHHRHGWRDRPTSRISIDPATGVVTFTPDANNSGMPTPATMTTPQTLTLAYAVDAAGGADGDRRRRRQGHGGDRSRHRRVPDRGRWSGCGCWQCDGGGDCSGRDASGWHRDGRRQARPALRR